MEGIGEIVAVSEKGLTLAGIVSTILRISRSEEKRTSIDSWPKPDYWRATTATFYICTY